MLIDNSGTIILILFGLLLGIVGCLYVIFRFFRRRSRKTREPARPGWTKRLAGWLSEPAGAPAVARPELPESSLEQKPFEVFRVVRMGPMGKLMVEVGGQRYSTIVDIKDGAVGRRVLLAVQELGEFVGPHGAWKLPAMHRQGELAEYPAEREPELTVEQQEFLAQLEATSPDGAIEERGAGVVEFLQQKSSPSAQKAGAASEPEVKSFVDELEELLQVRMTGRPEMSGRSVHFRSTPEGELRIEVDGREYEAIEDIPDSEIVAELRATISDWEQD
jgi:hypothetical protein